MGTPFNMKGSAFYGKGNQSPVSQIGGLPEKVAPVRPAPAAPAAPSAAGLDYVNPTEGSSPMAQVATKTKVSDVDAMTKNKIEAYQAKAAQGGPIEQKKQPKTYSGQTTSLKSHKNKMQRLTGKTVTYKDAWQGMPAHKRKSKFGDDYNKFVGEAEKFNKENKSYKKGTVKYQRYQGTY